MHDAAPPIPPRLRGTSGVKTQIERTTTGAGDVWTVRVPMPLPAHDPYTPTDAQRLRFERLASQWRNETRLSSSVSNDHSHIAYLGILSIGKPALRLILEELQANGGNWFLALRLIAETNPVPPEHAGKVKLMREDWLAWGRLRDYL